MRLFVRRNRLAGEKASPKKLEGMNIKRLILVSCTMAVLGFSAIQTVAFAQETPGIDGAWIGNVIAADCQPPHTPLPNAVPFRALYMFGHDGSLTTEAAFFVPIPPRSSGLGTWRHTQGQTYASKFWFFGISRMVRSSRFGGYPDDPAQRRPIHHFRSDRRVRRE